VNTYLVNGRSPQTTTCSATRSRAHLSAAADAGRDAFYKGEIAKAIVAKSHALAEP